MEISHIPYCCRIHQLGKKDYQWFQGDFTWYFADFISLDKDPVPGPCCFCVKEAIPLCPGKHADIWYLVASLPFLLTFKVADEHVALQNLDEPHKWDFPPSLFLGTEADANTHGLVYDLVCLALINEAGNYFIAHYASDNKSIIYTYDDMRNKGVPT